MVCLDDVGNIRSAVYTGAGAYAAPVPRTRVHVLWTPSPRYCCKIKQTLFRVMHSTPRLSARSYNSVEQTFSAHNIRNDYRRGGACPSRLFCISKHTGAGDCSSPVPPAAGALPLHPSPRCFGTVEQTLFRVMHNHRYLFARSYNSAEQTFSAHNTRNVYHWEIAICFVTHRRTVEAAIGRPLYGY